MKKDYYLKVTIVRIEKETGKEEVIDGVKYFVKTKKQAQEDLAYIEGYMNC